MRRFVYLVFLFASLAGPTSADEVSLRAPDGGLEVSGDLISFDGEFYVVDTEYGQLSVDGTGIVCDGPGCPNLSNYVAEVRMAGVPKIASTLLSSLVKSFADFKGLDVAENSELITLFDPGTGQIVARIYRASMPAPEAFAQQLAGETDIVLADHSALRSDVIFAAGAGIGDLDSPNQAKLVAFDAVVPIVSPRNVVDEIRLEDLANIFAGEISYWAQIGGTDAPVYPHSNRDDSASTALFLERLMIGDDSNIAASVTRHPYTTSMADLVNVDPFALAITMKSVAGDGKVLTVVDSCGLRMSASGTELASGDYPLVAPIYFYLTAARQPKIFREFIRFAQSEDAHSAIEAAGYVPNKIAPLSLNEQPYRVLNAISATENVDELNTLKQLAETLSGFSRLSVSFRFARGLERFDAQSVSGIGTLAEALETGAIAPKEIIFAGFRDESAEAGYDIAMAELVRDSLLDQAVTFDTRQVKIKTIGYGTASPLACDKQTWGRWLNNRVEVWVR